MRLLITPETLRMRLTERRQDDPKLRLFGASTHQYRLKPCIQVHELESVEKRLGTTLPEEYRGFLLTCGNGGAGPGYGILGLAEAIREFGDEPLDGVARPFRPPRCAAAAETDRPYPDDGMIPIAHAGCGNMWVLIVSGAERGYVWGYQTAGDYAPESVERPDYRGAVNVEDRLAANDRWLDSLLGDTRKRLTFWDWYQIWLGDAAPQLLSSRTRWKSRQHWVRHILPR